MWHEFRMLPEFRALLILIIYAPRRVMYSQRRARDTRVRAAKSWTASQR